MRILGIDYGEARTGLAISDENEMLATVVGTIHERANNRCQHLVFIADGNGCWHDS